MMLAICLLIGFVGSAISLAIAKLSRVNLPWALMPNAIGWILAIVIIDMAERK